jgi:hypothetical protein
MAPRDIGHDERLRNYQFKSSRIQNQGDKPAAQVESPLMRAIACYRKMMGMLEVGSTAQGTG